MFYFGSLCQSKRDVTQFIELDIVTQFIQYNDYVNLYVYCYLTGGNLNPYLRFIKVERNHKNDLRHAYSESDMFRYFC